MSQLKHFILPDNIVMVKLVGRLFDQAEAIQMLVEEGFMPVSPDGFVIGFTLEQMVNSKAFRTFAGHDEYLRKMHPMSKVPRENREKFIENNPQYKYYFDELMDDTAHTMVFVDNTEIKGILFAGVTDSGLLYLPHTYVDPNYNFAMIYSFLITALLLQTQKDGSKADRVAVVSWSVNNQKALREYFGEEQFIYSVMDFAAAYDGENDIRKIEDKVLKIRDYVSSIPELDGVFAESDAIVNSLFEEHVVDWVDSYGLVMMSGVRDIEKLSPEKKALLRRDIMKCVSIHDIPEMEATRNILFNAGRIRTNASEIDESNIIMRCSRRVYREYMESIEKGEPYELPPYESEKEPELKILDQHSPFLKDVLPKYLTEYYKDSECFVVGAVDENNSLEGFAIVEYLCGIRIIASLRTIVVAGVGDQAHAERRKHIASLLSGFASTIAYANGCDYLYIRNYSDGDRPLCRGAEKGILDHAAVSKDSLPDRIDKFWEDENEVSRMVKAMKQEELALTDFKDVTYKNSYIITFERKELFESDFPERYLSYFKPRFPEVLRGSTLPEGEIEAFTREHIKNYRAFDYANYSESLSAAVKNEKGIIAVAFAKRLSGKTIVLDRIYADEKQDGEKAVLSLILTLLSFSLKDLDEDGRIVVRCPNAKKAGLLQQIVGLISDTTVETEHFVRIDPSTIELEDDEEAYDLIDTPDVSRLFLDRLKMDRGTEPVASIMDKSFANPALKIMGRISEVLGW